MSSKQRFTFMFVLVSLTATMLFFQNCSQSGSLYDGSSVTDPFIVDPPVIFASKSSACTTPATTFAFQETIFMCVQNAGLAPVYCHALSTSTTCTQIVVSTAQGWTSPVAGNWVRGFSVATGGAFSVGTFTAYAVHTDDTQAFSSTTFTVQ